MWFKKWNECNYKIVIGEIDNDKYVSAIDIYNDKRIFLNFSSGSESVSVN